MKYAQTFCPNIDIYDGSNEKVGYLIKQQFEAVFDSTFVQVNLIVKAWTAWTMFN